MSEPRKSIRAERDELRVDLSRARIREAHWNECLFKLCARVRVLERAGNAMVETGSREATAEWRALVPAKL